MWIYIDYLRHRFDPDRFSLQHIPGNHTATVCHIYLFILEIVHKVHTHRHKYTHTHTKEKEKNTVKNI